MLNRFEGNGILKGGKSGVCFGRGSKKDFMLPFPFLEYYLTSNFAPVFFCYFIKADEEDEDSDNAEGTPNYRFKWHGLVCYEY